MSYFSTITARANGPVHSAFTPANSSRSPIAKYDQRLYHASSGTPLMAPALTDVEVDAPNTSDNERASDNEQAPDDARTGPTRLTRDLRTTMSEPSAALVPSVARSELNVAPQRDTVAPEVVVVEPSAPRSVQRERATVPFAPPLKHTDTATTPFVPRRDNDVKTPSFEGQPRVDVPPLAEPDDRSLAPRTSSVAALSQALAAVQSWMTQPTEPSKNDASRALEWRPAPRTATKFLTQPTESPSTMAPLEPRTPGELPALEVAPKLHIGRIEIEIVRPQAVPPTPAPQRPLPSTYGTPSSSTAGRASVTAQKTSGLDAKRNFGMRQR